MPVVIDFDEFIALAICFVASRSQKFVLRRLSNDKHINVPRSYLATFIVLLKCNWCQPFASHHFFTALTYTIRQNRSLWTLSNFTAPRWEFLRKLSAISTAQKCWARFGHISLHCRSFLLFLSTSAVHAQEEQRDTSSKSWKRYKNFLSEIDTKESFESQRLIRHRTALHIKGQRARFMNDFLNLSSLKTEMLSGKDISIVHLKHKKQGKSDCRAVWGLNFDEGFSEIENCYATAGASQIAFRLMGLKP